MSVVGLQPQRSTRDGSEAASHLRPKVVRRDTDNILSYYQSEHAGRAYTAPDAIDRTPTSLVMTEESPYAPSHSRSSSEYSSDSSLYHNGDAGAPSKWPQPRTPSGSKHARRPSVPSEGGADRRRLAIVELDSTQTGSQKRRHGTKTPQPEVSTPSTILSRRGIHVDGLALVAPPDASPRTYTDLTPPSTAPLSIDRVPLSSLPSHQRSNSETVSALPRVRHQHKSSRDVGIVGMVPSVSETPELGASDISDEYVAYSSGDGLKVPVFQTPTESRSPSPGRTPEVSESSTLGVLSGSSSAVTTPDPERSEGGILTPAIGESKDISQPVVGPVVVGITANVMRTNPAGESSPNSSRPAMTTPDEVHAARQATYAHSPQPSVRSESPYLYYEPGVHSTAGPLPPPPQPIIDNNIRLVSAPPAPPRPPRAYTPLSSSGVSDKRDIRALKESLQLPKHVSAALASITPSPDRSLSRTDLQEQYTQSTEDVGPSSSLKKSRSLHVREGAHPPSTVTNSFILLEDTTVQPTHDESALATAFPVTEDLTSESESAASPPEPVTQARRTGLELHRQTSWVSVRQEQGERASSPNGRPQPLPHVSVSRSSTSSADTFSHIPPPPPKSARGSPVTEDERSSASNNPLRGALTNLKRFSALPRTPSSVSSASKSKSPSSGPSPQIVPMQLPSRRKPGPRKRVKLLWPDAMKCSDVMAQKNALERSRGYAEKINELAMYECGLSEWLQDWKYPGTRTAPRNTLRSAMGPATPSSRAFAQQPRHTSHGSTTSEATFPLRADAYSATDLSTRPIDVLPPNAPPPSLPYPSLAQAQGSRNSLRSSTILTSPSRNLLPLPVAKSHGGGFFASIGRKTSIRKDKPALTPLSSSRVLSKRHHAANESRPPAVQVATAPSVPGGPRVAPGRIQRAQTFSVATKPLLAEKTPVPASSTHPNRQSSMARRPSLFARARGQGQVTAAAPVAQSFFVSTPEFEQQVDKLADLLPHADRDVLAGYLRRAGQDILAIGQYLDDEKNGMVRRD